MYIQWQVLVFIRTSKHRITEGIAMLYKVNSLANISPVFVPGSLGVKTIEVKKLDVSSPPGCTGSGRTHLVLLFCHGYIVVAPQVLVSIHLYHVSGHV